MSATNSNGGGYGFRAPRVARPRNDGKLPRRTFLKFAAAAAAVPVATRRSSAQTYPNKPIRLLVGYPAGGQIDIVARLTAQFLAQPLGQSVVVENHPGAGGSLGAEAIVKAPPDGYTLFMGTTANAINASLLPNLSFDFARNVAPVGAINRINLVVEAHPSFAATSVAELIALAKAEPGKLDVASPSIGTPPYMAVELLKMMAGIDAVHVPYGGEGQMITDLLGGQQKVAIGGISAGIGHIKAGKLRALAVTGASRVAELPGIPTIAETLPGFEASGWSGLVAPKDTPAAIIDTLYGAVRTIQADPQFKARLAELGVSVLELPPAAFGTFIADETEKWRKVVKFAGLKAG